MALDPRALSEEALTFLTERHLATLTTLRSDGSPHVCAVGFTWDAEHALARVITSEGSQKVRNVDRSAQAAVAQVDGGRWLSLAGPARVTRDPDEIADAVARYTQRYGEPRVNPSRVAIVVTIDRILGRA